MTEDNEDEDEAEEWNWSAILIVATIIVACFIYEIVDTVTFNRALEACALSSGDIHVTWNGRHYCNHLKQN